MEIKEIPIIWKEKTNENYSFSYFILVSPFSKQIQDLSIQRDGEVICPKYEEYSGKIEEISKGYYPCIENKTGTRLNLYG